MAVSVDALRRLAELYDQWQAASALPDDAVAIEQYRLRGIAAAHGAEFLDAFNAMVRNARTEDAATSIPPLNDALRDAAFVAARSASADVNASEITHDQARLPLNPEHRAPVHTAGQDVGPYRLIRELGRGGMGVVWLAARADGQHERQVALKMPLVENLNWLLAARFARERNILASLEHPGIARLYDAGVDELTQPYIAIEYVPGQPITNYVKEKKLAPEATVLLFSRVIEAVAHAHAQLVIHRDIKPANILVDAKGEPHLLDFGIAKLLDDEDSETADATQLTRLSGRALTLDYASPEQVNNAPLGTASDVYSLGVVLYELLTGSRPYQPKGATRRDLEIAILEQEPGKPSDQWLRTGDSESGKSARRMRGDLDTIVLKSLRKEPKQRYGSAQAFADDLKRYLAFEPILARPDRFAYRLRKFLRRQRVPLIVAAIGCAAVAAVGIRALQQTQLAQISVTRAQSVDGLIGSLFQGMSPHIAATRTFSAKELLDRAQQFLNSDASVDDVSRRVANLRLAELYGDIGATADAARLFANERAAAAVAGDTRAEAVSLAKLAEAQTLLRQLPAAKMSVEQLAVLLATKIAPPDELYGRLAFQRGRISLFEDQPAAAAKHFSDAVTLMRATGTPPSALLADALQGEGSAQRALGKLDLARERYTEALTLYLAVGNTQLVEQLSTLASLADVENAAGNYEVARTLLDRALPDMEARLGPDHQQTLLAVRTLAFTQMRTGRISDAQNTINKLRSANEPNRIQLRGFVDFFNATLAMYSGDYGEAERLILDVLKSAPVGTIGTARLNRRHGEILLRAGRLAEAGQVLRAVEALQVSLVGEAHVDVAITRILVSCVLARSDDIAAARSLIGKSLDVLRRERGDAHWLTLLAMSYQALFSEQGSPLNDVALKNLADRIDREVGSLAAAPELAQWLRQWRADRDWKAMPVVF